MNDYLQHSQKIVVTVNDADFLGQVKPSAIMGYFQDVATEHAEVIDVGYDKMIAANLGWVLIRMSYKIVRSPRIGETLTIKTFPEKPKNSDTNRGYYIYDSSGEAIVLGSSKWCVIDLTTYKLQRCAPLFAHFESSAYIPHQPFDDANPKLPYNALAYDNRVNFEVRVTDLDRYFHMNNARYGDVVLNTCGVDMLKNNSIVRYDANFISQLFVGDKYDAYKTQADNVTNIEVRKAGSNDIAFRARVEWQPR